MDWMKSEDKLKLDKLEIKSNYSSWEVAKGYLKKSRPFNAPFYIHAEFPAGLILDEAKQLRDYLDEKIAYLEG